MGAMHTRMFHKLRKEFPDQVERSMQSTPITYEHTNQLLRTLEFGQEPAEELVKKALVTEALDVHSKTPPSEEYDNDEVLRMRAFVDALNTEQIDYIIANFDVLQSGRIDESRTYMYKVMDAYEDYVYGKRRVQPPWKKIGNVSKSRYALRQGVPKNQTQPKPQTSPTIQNPTPEDDGDWL
jgi:hypothetical protein